jgi:hypothetical protein
MNAVSAPRKKRRNLQSDRKARLHQLYSSDDVVKLYGTSRNTLTNWIADGVGFIDVDQRLFCDSDLNSFHKQSQVKARGIPLVPCAASCFGCKRSRTHRYRVTVSREN